MDGITGFGPGKAAATGVAIGALNPKNVAMAVAASFAVGAADLTSGETVAVVVVYVVLASAGVAAPLATTLVLGDRARPVLASWRTWLEANNDVVMAVLYLLFGVVLVGKGIAQY
jgi:threonine/homoserine/homoserine lactone efflux protein